VIFKVLCGSFGLYPSYAAGIPNYVKEIYFCVLCSEKLNYSTYIKNVFTVKNGAVLIKHIQEIISGYHLVMRNFNYRMKKDNFQNYHRINIRAKCFIKNALIVTSLRYCSNQQTCGIYH